MVEVPPIEGVVLAAGRSARMGSPKPLLRAGAETFLERAARCLREGGCRSVTAVVSAADAAIGAHARETGALVIENPDPFSQQIDSLRLALARLPADTAAAMILPVDFPLFRPATVRAIADAFRRGGGSLVVPTHGDVAGHPVLVARAEFDAIMGEVLPEGLRSLLDARAGLLVEVPVEDEAIHTDIDTPEQYERLRSAGPGSW
jgi:CTP:molybdopterin cytidylyltransferase MocA